MMQHTPFSGTAEQRANIEKLAAYVEKYVSPSYFSMIYYRDDDSGPTKTAHSCGTVACFVGYGPDAGIVSNDSYSDYSDWDNYSRSFVNFGSVATQSNQWMWLFSDQWARVDNTPAGATARARYLLEHGLPENWQQQMHGDEPISYMVSE